MTTAAWFAQPPVARFGFDNGWHFFPPSFLNLGMPGVLVDSRLLACPVPDLEHFAERDPGSPWRDTKFRLRCSDGCTSVWLREPDRLVATSFGYSQFTTMSQQHRVVLFVGNSYDVELSWSSLWDCQVGLCTLERR